MTDLKRMKILYENAGPEARRELILLMWIENRIEDWRMDPSEVIAKLRRHYEGDREANLSRIAAMPRRSDELPASRKHPDITPLTFEDAEPFRQFSQSQAKKNTQ